ncbi:MAG: hypothetical protein HYU37_07960 [Acidobacteria bacterium]|nr:hypothetical protein [Acidobacteriota bacterium]
MNPPLAQLTRREFLRTGTIGAAAVSALGFDLTAAYAQVRELKIARTTETLLRKLSYRGLRRRHHHVDARLG